MARPASIRAIRYAGRGLLAGVAAVLAVSCSAPPGATPESALQTFLRALGASDPATACSVVAYGEQPLRGDDILLCRSAFETVVREVATPAELAALRGATVTAAVVTGDRAVVRPEMIAGVPAAYQQEVSLVRVDGAWYVVTPRS